jgi:hypothetical protein
MKTLVDRSAPITMNYCHARHCDKWLYFPGEKPMRFYRPYRCGEDALPGELLCAKCNVVPPGKTQMSRGFNHGLVGDLIPPDSHAYGGSWYLSMVAKKGEPSKETLSEATEYLEEDFDTTAGAEIAALFRAGMSSTKVEMSTRSPAAAATAVPKKKRSSCAATAVPKKKSSSGAGGKASAPSITQHIHENCQTAAEKIVELSATFTPRIVEALTEPLDVCEVEQIDIEPFKFDGEKYYRNPETNDIYRRLTNKGVGPLLGRFNEEAQAIVLIDDE